MPAALIRRTSQAANILLALALLTALVSFASAAELFFAGCFLHALAALPSVLHRPSHPATEGDPDPIPALQ
jgi:hypothetical protein